MLLYSDGDMNRSDVITWLYVDAFKIDSDISAYPQRYRRVWHDTWPLSPIPNSAAALDKAIKEIKRE